jgi:hypothetical protein
MPWAPGTWRARVASARPVADLIFRRGREHTC